MYSLLDSFLLLSETVVRTTVSDSNKKLSKSEYIQKAQDAYDSAQSALKDGDWTAYGKYMKELSNYLDKLS